MKRLLVGVVILLSACATVGEAAKPKTVKSNYGKKIVKVDF